MTKSETETDTLESHGGYLHLLKRRARPSQQDPVEFALTLLFRDPAEETEHVIARIDTDHGGVHIDRFWLESPDQDFRPDWGMWEDAYPWFFEKINGVSRWRILSNKYQENHFD